MLWIFNLCWLHYILFLKISLLFFGPKVLICSNFVIQLKLIIYIIFYFDTYSFNFLFSINSFFSSIFLGQCLVFVHIHSFILLFFVLNFCHFIFYWSFIFIQLNSEILIYVGDHFKINIASFFFFFCFLLFLSDFWIRWFYNFIICTIIMIIYDFFYCLFDKKWIHSSGQFNDFHYLDSNVDNNFNCYSNDNDNNVGMNFQFMFSSF